MIRHEVSLFSLTVSLLMILQSSCAVASEDRRTVSTAHQFLKLTLEKGSIEIQGECTVIGVSDKCVSRDGKVVGYSPSSDGCGLYITYTVLDRYNNTSFKQVKAKWGQVSSVTSRGSRVYLAGSFEFELARGQDSKYYTSSYITLLTESMETSIRIAAAGDFLRNQCDLAKGTGF